MNRTYTLKNVTHDLGEATQYLSYILHDSLLQSVSNLTLVIEDQLEKGFFTYLVEKMLQCSGISLNIE